MRRFALVFALILVGSVLTGPPVASQETAAWTPAKSMEFRQIQDVAISPDGSRVAYVVRVPVLEGEKSEYLTQIWVVRADGAGRWAGPVARSRRPVALASRRAAGGPVRHRATATAMWPSRGSRSSWSTDLYRIHLGTRLPTQGSRFRQDDRLLQRFAGVSLEDTGHPALRCSHGCPLLA